MEKLKLYMKLHNLSLRDMGALPPLELPEWLELCSGMVSRPSTSSAADASSARRCSSKSQADATRSSALEPGPASWFLEGANMVGRWAFSWAFEGSGICLRAVVHAVEAAPITALAWMMPF